MSDCAFKTPALPPGGLANAVDSSTISDSKLESTEENKEHCKESSTPVPPLNYTPPSWACEPPVSSGYRLEVLKSGSIVDCINLDNRKNSTFITIGRLPNCDVVLEHPSISRYHCILQFGEDLMGKSGKGWHVFDLGSTHGTKTNKRRVPEKQYIRTFVGFVFQFGGSSRLLNLIGPDEDQEAEWDCSPTEMREKQKRKALEAKLAAAARTEFEQDNAREAKDEGINWGMDYGDEDAVPFFLEGHGEEDGEAYYVNDPKSALSKFFDREGFEMKFDYSESGSGHTHKWTCSIELPIEIAGVDRACIAQATTNTSKKDATAQCALEACKILDKHGVLRNSNTKARMKKKTLADNDYYDEDDDLYLDRTGQLEQQREKRKQWAERDAGKAVPVKDTFESLSKKLEETREEMKNIQKQLDALSQTISNKGLESSDSLDDYCRQLSTAGGLKDDLKTKTQKSMLRQQLVKLTHESQTLEKLVRIARPVKMPELKVTTASGTVIGSNKQAFLRKMMMVGRIKKDSEKKSETSQEISPADDKKLTVFKPEEDEKDDPKIEQTNSEKNSPIIKATDEPSTSMKLLQNNESLTDDTPAINGVTEAGKETCVLSKISETKIVLEPKDTESGSQIDHSTDAAIVESENKRKADESLDDDTSKKRKIRPRPNRHKNQEYGASCDTKDELYATWLPPADQSGDGRTKLHDKFGGKY